MVKTQDNKRNCVITKSLKKNKNAKLLFPRSMNDLEKLSGKKCHERKKYHENMCGCGAIDASIEKHFGSKYKIKLFNYYRVVGDLGSTRSLLRKLISNDDVRSVGEFSLRRKGRDKLRNENISIPSGYEEKFPVSLEPSDIFGTTGRLLEQGKSWIANCVIDRITFRDLCVKSCNSKLLDLSLIHI